MGPLHRAVHLLRRRGGVGRHGGPAVLPARLQAVRPRHDPRRIPGDLGRRHVRPLHRDRHGAAVAPPQRPSVPDTVVDDVLGHARAWRLPRAERGHHARDPRGRTDRHGAASLDQARHRALDPVGHQHPHRDGLPLQRPARALVLADGDAGPALPRVGVRGGTGAADPAVPGAPPVVAAAHPARGDCQHRHHRGVRDRRARVLRAARAVHGLLQPGAGAREPPGVSLRGAGRPWRARAVDVDVGGPGRGVSGAAARTGHAK